MKLKKKKITKPSELRVNDEKPNELAKKVKIMGDSFLAEKLELKTVNINTVVKDFKRRKHEEELKEQRKKRGHSLIRVKG